MHAADEARATRRLQRLEIGRLQVLDAAEALFAERGYAATSLESIAMRSGFSVGGLYVFFKSKEALYAAAIERRGALIQQRMGEYQEQPLSGLEKLLGMVSVALGTLQEYPAYGRLVVQALGSALATGPDRRADNGQFEEGVIRYAAAIEQGQAEGQIRAGDARQLAIVVAGMIMMHAQIDSLIAGDPQGMSTAEFLEIVRNAIRPAS
jgi:AcrR family transcriptional regulator